MNVRCKGDWSLGTACGECDRCRDTALAGAKMLQQRLREMPQPSAPPHEGGPAFPAADMSLRDWFAGQALVGLISIQAIGEMSRKGLTPQQISEYFADAAYDVSDAMIAEREKKP